MVSNDDGLLRLGNSDSGSALFLELATAIQYTTKPNRGLAGLTHGLGWVVSHRSGVDASVLSSGQDEPGTSNIETFSEGLVLSSSVAADNAGNGLHFLGLELFGKNC